jgi:hypothetical protein
MRVLWWIVVGRRRHSEPIPTPDKPCRQGTTAYPKATCRSVRNPCPMPYSPGPPHRIHPVLDDEIRSRRIPGSPHEPKRSAAKGFTFPRDALTRVCQSTVEQPSSRNSGAAASLPTWFPERQHPNRNLAEFPRLQLFPLLDPPRRLATLRSGAKVQTTGVAINRRPTRVGTPVEPR